MQLLKILRDSVIILFITLAILVCLEVALRILYPSRCLQESPYEFDPQCLWRTKKNINSKYYLSDRNGGTCIEWKTNAHGFRGEELLENPDLRIMVYGDSNIQARFSSIDKTLVFQLQEILSTRLGKRIEVINAGVIGYGPDQYLLKMKEELPVYKPDLVLVNFFADNDFGDPIRNRLLFLDENALLKKTSFNRASMNASGKEKLMDRYLLLKAINKLKKKMFPQERNEHQIGLALVKLFFSLSQKEFAVYSESKPRVQEDIECHYDIDLALTPESESSKLKRRFTTAIFKEMKSFCDERHIPFAVIIEPSSTDLTTNFKIDYTHFKGYEKYKPENLSNEAEKILAELGVVSLNLFPDFKNAKSTELYFKFDDNHWNDAGQKFAAPKIASFVLDKKLLST